MAHGILNRACRVKPPSDHKRAGSKLLLQSWKQTCRCLEGVTPGLGMGVPITVPHILFCASLPFGHGVYLWYVYVCTHLWTSIFKI